MYKLAETVEWAKERTGYLILNDVMYFCLDIVACLQNNGASFIFHSFSTLTWDQVSDARGEECCHVSGQSWKPFLAPQQVVLSQRSLQRGPDHELLQILFKQMGYFPFQNLTGTQSSLTAWHSTTFNKHYFSKRGQQRLMKFEAPGLLFMIGKTAISWSKPSTIYSAFLEWVVGGLLELIAVFPIITIVVMEHQAFLS